MILTISHYFDYTIFMQSSELLHQLLSIPSPTFEEADKSIFLQNWLKKNAPHFHQTIIGNNIIAQSQTNHATTIGFIGHLDHVPDWFKPFEEDGKMYGAGASDMQAGIASYLSAIIANPEWLNATNIMIVLYDKEEGTTLHKNGLYECIQAYPNLISTMNVAIVAEPTNNTIQLGCVGSLHATLTVFGKAAHSARPWHGINALYEAVPFIQRASTFIPIKQTMHGVSFFDVLQITESKSSNGKTTIPEKWQANINYRFSPCHSITDAEAFVTKFVHDCEINNYTLTIEHSVAAGAVNHHPVLDVMKKKLALPIEAKQAWTDVAQLSECGICAFNVGPGRQDQAHRPDEYVVLDDMTQYEAMLSKILGGYLSCISQ